MKRITTKQMEEIATKLLNEVDLHFRLQNVLVKETKQTFSFWNEKEIDALLMFKHYCNLKDLSYYVNDVEKFYDIIVEINKNDYNYDLIFTEFSTIKFYQKDK